MKNNGRNNVSNVDDPFDNYLSLGWNEKSKENAGFALDWTMYKSLDEQRWLSDCFKEII